MNAVTDHRWGRPTVVRQGHIGPKARAAGVAIPPLVRRISPSQEPLIVKVATAV